MIFGCTILAVQSGPGYQEIRVTCGECTVQKAFHRLRIILQAAMAMVWFLTLSRIVYIYLVGAEMFLKLTLVRLNIVLSCWLLHTDVIGSLNDLWRYNISSQQWTWISGSNTVLVAGVYGTKGVPSNNNYPGGRYSHSMTINPNLGCIFVFGGNGYAQTTTFGMTILHAVWLY